VIPINYRGQYRAIWKNKCLLECYLPPRILGLSTFLNDETMSLPQAPEYKESELREYDLLAKLLRRLWVSRAARYATEFCSHQFEADVATVEQVETDLAAYEQCMLYLQQVKFLTIKDVIRAHHCFLPSARPGFRADLAWVGGATPNDADWVAMPAECLAGAIRDWLGFVNHSGNLCWHGLALSYAQFIHIHPFPDANGRFVRCLHAWLAGRFGVSEIECSLLWLHQILTARELLIPAMARLRDGDDKPYWNYWGEAMLWVNSEVHWLRETTHGSVSKELIGEWYSHYQQLIGTHAEGTAYALRRNSHNSVLRG